MVYGEVVLWLILKSPNAEFDTDILKVSSDSVSMAVVYCIPFALLLCRIREVMVFHFVHAEVSAEFVCMVHES